MMEDKKLKDVALNFQANISDKLLKENMELKKEISALQTKLKESPENFNKDSTPESMLNADLISRQAVLDAFWNLNVELRPSAIDAILKTVNDMPPVNPQSKTWHWILVSERLPEENEEVLVTFKSDDEIRVYNCKYFDNSPWWKNYVIAWMSLPEPFKAERR